MIEFDDFSKFAQSIIRRTLGRLNMGGSMITPIVLEYSVGQDYLISKTVLDLDDNLSDEYAQFLASNVLADSLSGKPFVLRSYKDFRDRFPECSTVTVFTGMGVSFLLAMHKLKDSQRHQVTLAATVAVK